jgi:hypothetical protein
VDKWSTANKLALKLDKTNIIEFITNNSPKYSFNTGYDDKYIELSAKKKIPFLQNDNH